MLDRWEPEDQQFWEQTGKGVANRTLWITTGALFLSFATWFMWSAIIVRMPNVGFQLSAMQKFWLAAMPGLSGATLRIPYTFLIQKFGTRKVVTLATASLLIPALAAGWVVQHPGTSFTLLLFLAFLAGFGGGNFAAFMSSTSYFFPKRKQGLALGIQAGIGNFGVSATQFIVPAVITTGVFATIFGGAQAFVKDGKTSDLWLQNAGYIYVIPVLLFTIAAAIWLRDIPVKGTISGQFVIFKEKHNWFMTSLYFMTFGSFSGLSASFPLMIKELFQDIPNPPDPLAYAFLGPLIGSAIRPIGGWISDKTGGAIITHISGIMLLAGAIVVTFFTTGDNFTMFLVVMLVLFFAAGLGNGSTFRQIPIIFDPKKAGPVLGWTSAIAAYGSFLFPVLIGWSISKTGGSPNAFFYFMAVFFAANVALNWYYYTRKKAEVRC
ncbi:MAG: nitrate/nitrite transporter [Actinomycetota bacterium]